jgi:hypothetical protein
MAKLLPKFAEKLFRDLATGLKPPYLLFRQHRPLLYKLWLD